MKVSMSLVVVCLVATSCGDHSAISAGVDSRASVGMKVDLLPGNSLSAGQVRDRNSPLAGVASPNQLHEVVLRNSYYKCVQASDGSAWDMQACIEKEFLYQDGRLNAIYRDMRSKMDDAARIHFKAEERQWLSDRDVSCQWNASADGQAQRIDANVCSLKMTAARVSQLEKRGQVSGL